MRYRISDVVSTAERRYTLVAAAAAVCLLSLVPSPSPLFHILFLPLLMILNKHDRPLLLALNCAFFAILLLTRLIQLEAIGQIPLIVAETSGTVTITTSIIICHQRIIASLALAPWTTGGDRSSSIGGSLSFGILWAAAWTAVGYDDLAMSLTPPATQFPFLRRILRHFGGAGIDILLGASAYSLFTAIDGVLVPDQDEQEMTGGAGWEWTRLAVLRSFTTSSRSSRSSRSSESATAPNSHLDGPSGPDRFSSMPPSTHPRTSTRWQSTSWSTTSTTATRHYGSTLTRHSENLIDLESGPTRAAVREPDSGRQPMRTDFHSSSSSGSSPSTASSVLLGKEDSEGEQETEERQTHIPALLILLLVWAVLLLAPVPTPVSLSSPISVQTPLSVACVLPPSSSALSDWIYHSQMVAGRSKLLVWPNNALHFSNRNDVKVAVDAVHRDVAGKYGVWVMMGIATGKKGVTSETIMVGPEGRMGNAPGEATQYDEEAASWDAFRQWTINLPPPHGVVRFNWTHDFPHLRPIHIAAINGASSRTPMRASPSLPSMLVVTPPDSISPSDLLATTALAIKHGVPVITCASSLSGVVDSWGNPLFQQVGGETWSLNMGLSFRDGQDRPKTGDAQLGELGTIAIAFVLLFCILLVELVLGRAQYHHPNSHQNQLEGTAADVDGWMGSIARRWRGSISVSSSATPRTVSGDIQAHRGAGSTRTE